MEQKKSFKNKKTLILNVATFGKVTKLLSITTPDEFKANRRKYQGNEYITDLGLHWMDFNNRQYDPQLGRFLSIDPLAAANGQDMFGPYAAMGNTPEVVVDPNGLSPEYNLDMASVSGGGGGSSYAGNVLTLGMGSGDGYGDNRAGGGSMAAALSAFGLNGCATVFEYAARARALNEMIEGAPVISEAPKKNFDGSGTSDGGANPQSGGSKTPDDFVTVTGEMFVNGKGVAAANYSTKDNKGKLVVGVDKFGAIIYDIGEDLSKSNPKIAPEGVVAIDESRWDKESICSIPRFLVTTGMKYALTPMIGESTTNYAIQKFKDGNGQASFMGSTSTYYDGARYNVLNFRVQFDLVIQRVNTSIWIDISTFHKLDQRP